MNLKHLLRLSFAERMDAYTRLRAEGKITAEDVARNENMNPPRPHEPLVMTVCAVTREKVEARRDQRCPKCLRLSDRHLTLAEKTAAAWDAEYARLAQQERRDKGGAE